MVQLEVQKLMKTKKAVEESPFNTSYFADFAGNFSTSSFKYGDDWIIDSGASSHVTGNVELLENLRPVTGKNTVTLPDGSVKTVTFIGNAEVSKNLKLVNVLFVPEFKYNLISVGKLVCDSSVQVHFHSSGCIVQDLLSKSILAQGRLEKSLFILCKNQRSTNCVLNVDVVNKDSDGSVAWHNRLGHPSSEVLLHLPIIDKCTKHRVCDSCHLAKQTRLSFKPSSISTTACFELLHIDVWGPYKTPSISGAHYMLTIVDDFSRAVWIYLMHNKTQVFGMLRNFLKHVQTQFDVSVKRIQTDNGTEFLINVCQDLFKENGIIHQKTCVYTPQQNGVMERKHRHLAQTARALLFHAGLSSKFWGEAMLTATYIINKLPTRVLNWKCPFEVLMNKVPKYSLMKVFGCLAYATNTSPHKTKFDPRSKKCMFVGYAADCRGYKLFDLEEGNIFVSRDVVFYEDSFPLKGRPESGSGSSKILTPYFCYDDTDDLYESEKAIVQPVKSVSSEIIPVEGSPVISSSSPVIVTDHSAVLSRNEEGENLNRRMSDRERKPPAWMKNYIAQESGARKIATEIAEIKEATSELQNFVTDGHILSIIQSEKEEIIDNKHAKNHEDDSDDEDEDEDSDDEEDDDDDDDKEKHHHHHHHYDHHHHKMDPELNVFFTPKDLRIGKKMPIFFAKKNPPSKSPKFLPKQKSDQIPFSSSHLPSLLKIFSFPKHSPQAKAMKYTLKHCEFPSMEGETKFCATSLESLLETTHKILGSQFKVLSTTSNNSSVPLQNYTITHVHKVTVPKVVGCHPLPYPYAVFYCHAQEEDTALYEVTVEGEEDGAKVEAKAVCHMDTSKWNTDHVAFDVLKVKPGTSPVCHFFPTDNLVCVPLSSE
ncbi:BURP domain-containing protein BNM2A-like [Senna tora]|uniref:BURP domain-containing protein BNM2A-like n=1 Tax=Senna tora TaxID=362788 RepID=A0A835CGR3_9FABA|nr:BURP domain-containing protein BNM2A-like [Senna tora]